MVPTLRLFYSLVIEDIDYLLYLDADTIVVDKIDLNDLNFSNTILACKDHIQESYKSKLSIPVDHYYNSGVLFIDHTSFKKKNCLDAILNVVKNHETLLFPDQDILNMALNEHIDSLPLNYNLFSTDVYFKRINSFFYKRYEILDFYSKSEIKEALQKPIILHATDLYGIRPWQKNTVHPYNEIYDYYIQKIFGHIEKEDMDQECNKFLFRLYTTDEIFKNLILKK